MSSKMPKASRKKIVLARKRTYLAVVGLIIVLSAAAGGLYVLTGEDSSPSRQNTEVVVEGSSDELLCVRIDGDDDACIHAELVATPAELRRGLSGRSDLPSYQGMLFDFARTGEHCMWMPDMAFALDIVWLNADREIVTIKRDITPETYPESFCGDLAQYVLEVNSGVAIERGWSEGERLLW